MSRFDKPDTDYLPAEHLTVEEARAAQLPSKPASQEGIDRITEAIGELKNLIWEYTGRDGLEGLLVDEELWRYLRHGLIERERFGPPPGKGGVAILTVHNCAVRTQEQIERHAFLKGVEEGKKEGVKLAAKAVAHASTPVMVATGKSAEELKQALGIVERGEPWSR